MAYSMNSVKYVTRSIPTGVWEGTGSGVGVRHHGYGLEVLITKPIQNICCMYYMSNEIHGKIFRFYRCTLVHVIAVVPLH